MDPLVTLADVKVVLTPTPPSADDAKLTVLIAVASEWFAQETGLNVIVEETFSREAYHGTGSTTLVPAHRPIASVSRVTVDGSAIPRSTGATSAGFTWDTHAIYLRGGYRFGRGIRNVELTYCAGHDSVPADIQGWVIDAVSLAYKRLPHLDYQSKQLAGEVITFWGQAMPPQASRILATRRNVVPV